MRGVTGDILQTEEKAPDPGVEIGALQPEPGTAQGHQKLQEARIRSGVWGGRGGPAHTLIAAQGY